MELLLKSTVSSMESRTARKLQQATPRERHIFLEELNKHYETQNLYQRLQDLTEIPAHEWTQSHQLEYEKCDKQHIDGMLAAEKRTKRTPNNPWSPTFGKAISTKAFWKIAYSLKMTHRMPSDSFLTWADSLGIADLKGLDMAHIKQKLREAQKRVKELTKKADELRQNHLQDLIQQAEDNLDEKVYQKRLRQIQQAQERQQNFHRLRSIIKPTHSGGLSYVIVPKDFTPDEYPYDPDAVTEWEQIHEATDLQEYIQKRNITHFGQAHGTPFTISPLAEQLNWSATSKAAEDLIHGAVPLDLLSDNDYTNKVLEYIANRAQLPTIDTHMTREQVSAGFKKWREDTSTSPSGCHLGLRRIPAFSSPIKEIEATRGRIQQIQADIINIPIGIGFSPSRWQTIVNAMLEKIAGKPLLHKLRVIHIVEADYNLALKEIFGRRLMYNCERFGTLGDYQDGFQKGRSTIKTLLQNELFNDYNKRLRINNFVGMTDISGCFDRILPPIISLLNRRNGCPEEAVTCHAETLQNAKYFLKTKQGISTSSYSIL
jgi:hypothetical protein